MKQYHRKIAVVFPGQGSQSVGMLAELYENFTVVRDTYQEASDALAFDLWNITANGPAEDLNQTVNTQPAMLVAGVACYRVLQTHIAQKQADFVPAYFAGHSLGEYTALVAAGQLAFSDAVLLARKRAEAMQSAVPAGVGAMAAILGLDGDTINRVCSQTCTDDAKVWAANDNAPGQIVIAGHKAAVEAACEALKNAGAKRALLLPVSVPSHCPLMQPAANAMQAAFTMTNWQDATTPVIHNYDVAAHDKPSEIVTALTEQLIKPVRWVETIQYFADHRIEAVIEVGPGKILAGLNKRIDRNMGAKPLFDLASLNEVVEFLAQ
ncbi:MAG: [acyl-carrier-protein] S-malonyltransferase [Gammaproteobacteria bacterium]|nr:MAG: [acyl-carrier-protein] S-malonyltransferase [Gammaproteobacteria bacterium]